MRAHERRRPPAPQLHVLTSLVARPHPSFREPRAGRRPVCRRRACASVVSSCRGCSRVLSAPRVTRAASEGGAGRVSTSHGMCAMRRVYSTPQVYLTCRECCLSKLEQPHFAPCAWARRADATAAASSGARRRAVRLRRGPTRPRLLYVWRYSSLERQHWSSRAAAAPGGPPYNLRMPAQSDASPASWVRMAEGSHRAGGRAREGRRAVGGACGSSPQLPRAGVPVAGVVRSRREPHR